MRMSLSTATDCMERQARDKAWRGWAGPALVCLLCLLCLGRRQCLAWASQCEALRAICFAGLCPLLLTPGRNWGYCVFSRDVSKPAG